MSKDTMNFGDVVACDFCNYGEETMGGVLMGSYAVCGDCGQKHKYIKVNGDSIEYTEKAKKESDKGEIQLWDLEKSFRENVLEFRMKTTGTSNLTITIEGF